MLQRLYKEAAVGRHGLYPYNGVFPSWFKPMLEGGRAVTLLSRFIADPRYLHLSKRNLIADCTHLLYVKGGRFGALFDLFIGKLKPMGLIEKWTRDKVRFYRQWVDDARLTQTVNATNVITLTEILPALIALAAGTFASLLFFAIEILTLNCNSVKKSLHIC
jgi:hypothetical protein